MSKPATITNLFVDRPVIWLILVTLQLAAITILTVYMGWFVDSQTTNRDYLIWDDPKTINYDKSTLAQAALVAGVSDDKNAKLPLQTSIDRDWVMFLIYSE